jgi:CubicO group peptidase (beta-lactamase class C family)
MTRGTVWQTGPLGPMLGGLLREGRAEGAFPEGAAAVWHGGRRAGEAVLAGDHGDVHPQALRWDLASLTKPRVVGTLAMQAVSAGALDLDAPMSPDLPPHVTARALLGHRAGLPPFFTWWRALPPRCRAGSREARSALEALTRHAALESRPGAPACYSDIGFMLLYFELERRLGALRGRFQGFGGVSPPRAPERFVACGPCPARGRVVQGEVHDPQAWAAGGAAGHAGLFATARAVTAWGAGLVALARGAPTPSRGPLAGVSGDVVRAFWAAPAQPDGSTWRLAWDSPSAHGSSAGETVAPDAVGHLGFTGTSVWLEPARDLTVVLLTNRVALGERAQPRLRAFRPRFHDAVREAVARG